MTRRLKSRKAAKPEPTTKLDLDGYGVEERELSARPLVVIEPDSLLWGQRGILPASDVEGAIVWVLPPHDADDGDVLTLRGRLEKKGATHVKVMPRAPDPDIARVEQQSEEEQAESVADEKSADRSLREVVMTMARERASDEGLELLTNALDHALTEAGL